LIEEKLERERKKKEGKRRRRLLTVWVEKEKGITRIHVTRK
jgi:hypothetical protein